MSTKFDYGEFINYNGNEKSVAFNKKKYTKEQALEFISEEYKDDILEEVGTRYVRYIFGPDYYTDELIHGYWLEEEKHSNSVEVWCFKFKKEKKIMIDYIIKGKTNATDNLENVIFIYEQGVYKQIAGTDDFSTKNRKDKKAKIVRYLKKHKSLCMIW